MQTFVPHGGWIKANRALDDRRLGKQRIETVQILGSLFEGTGYKHHPVNDMWRGYELSLVTYGMCTLHIWVVERGCADSTIIYLHGWMQRLEDLGISPDPPPWRYDEDIIESHRSKLVGKLPAYYAPQFPCTRLQLPYLWARNDDGDNRGYRLFISKAESLRLGTEVELAPHLHMDPKTREVLPA